MWCHVLLAMPILGLGLFALLPFPVALTLYLVLVAGSLVLYARIIQAMRLPVQTGKEAMLGSVVTVTSDIGYRRGQARYGNELWSAVSEQQISAGEQARIVGVDGLRLAVQSLNEPQSRGNMVEQDTRE